MRNTSRLSVTGESDRYPEEAAEMQRVSCVSWRLKEIRSRSGGRRAVLQTQKEKAVSGRKREREK